MKSGEKIYVTTHYHLLNKILGTNYKGFMSGIKHISDDCYIWMVAIDGINRSGWINTIVDEDTITEEYVDGKPYPGNINDGVRYKKRFVFEKVKDAYDRTKYFIFHGLYELTNEGTYTCRVLRKIADETYLF